MQDNAREQQQEYLLEVREKTDLWEQNASVSCPQKVISSGLTCFANIKVHTKRATEPWEKEKMPNSICMCLGSSISPCLPTTIFI